MVIGLIILTGLIAYLIISIVIIYLGVQIAKRVKKPGWKIGVLTAMVMYLLLFWDLIPFHVAHKYYCETEGGYSAYKTLNEWKDENLEVASTPKPVEKFNFEQNSNKKKYLMNQRFAWEITTTNLFLDIQKRDNRIIDTKNNELMAQYIDFNSNQNTRNPKKFRDLKLWINVDSCESSSYKPNEEAFYKDKYVFKYMREHKQ
ncbi:MAG: TIGR04086 family membrane protein [Candidatus Thiodiazotropha taylori]|nr:TIGR04086 family membrane protein [Candidatus Thiodiazotropha taylori]MCG7971348.1 TIGR04086 family membrane protein [Candidatus Thiodiazotropha taylori]